jgi:copper transport protein
VRRRTVAACVTCLAVGALALVPAGAGAHAGFTVADPAPGATLGASPAALRLSFSERPQASLAEIGVQRARGGPVRAGRPQFAPGDPLTLVIPVPRLPRGVYTVTFRVVSAVDGHASSGTYAFGVRASPAGAAVTDATTKAPLSTLELVARWTLLAGLVALLGAAVAGAAGFGGARGTDLRLAGAGWLVSVAGLVLLAAAQTRAADTSLADFLRTPVGHALVHRVLAIAAAGVALLVARRRPGGRRLALAVAALAALVTIVIHVDAGHAAAGSWPRTVAVTAQAAHFAAAGIWFGGLAALLLGVRGAPTAAKAAAVRRFAVVALGALVVVAVTGTLRSIDELSSFGELVSTGYGRAILAKVGLLAVILGLAARNRRRGVPEAATDLGPLRRTSRVELVLALAALGVAAILGTLAPPVSGKSGGPVGLSASGSDFATTTKVKLTTASPEPGPNGFTAKVTDYDSGDSVRGARVRLTFTPLDDPGVDPTSLALRPRSDGAYAGSGPNLSFDGRWRVSALVQRGARAVQVPLELDVPGPKGFLSVLRPPGQDPKYALFTEGQGFVSLSPSPERAGPSTLTVDFTDVFQSEVTVRQVVLTTQTGDGPVRQVGLRRVNKETVVARVVLPEGAFTVTATARTSLDLRMRATFELDVPAR